jgi:hypothetical protein
LVDTLATLEGHQGKSSDEVKRGLKPTVPYTMKDLRKELTKYQTPAHAAFVGSSQQLTILSTNKPLQNYAGIKRKLAEGDENDWPSKVLLVCNDNMREAIPRALANYAVWKQHDIRLSLGCGLGWGWGLFGCWVEG